VLGFFQAADTACYLNTHDTPLIGASLTAVQAAQAQAPWFNSQISDTDLIPKEMSYFKETGVFAGKRIGVVGTSVDQQEMTLVSSALKKVGVHALLTAVNSVPASDSAAQIQEYGVIAERFKNAGVNLVIAVGNAGDSWPSALQLNQSSYLPKLVATNAINLDAYVSNKSGHSQAVLNGALTVATTPSDKVQWTDPSMKRCVATIQKAEPQAPISNPLTAAAGAPGNWVAPETACQQMALFGDIVKAAGKSLNNETFAKGGSSLSHITIPGGGGTFNFSHGHNDGDGPAFVQIWSPSAANLVPKATIG
jgi:hypothetical protein